jgi:hypothetical protein
MAQLTSDKLETMLTDYGWSFEPTGDNAWRTGFQGEQRLFPLVIKLTNTCVSFEVRPLIDLTLDSVRSPVLSRDLLELNARMQMVKVAVNETGEVSLSCQVLAAGFDYDMLGRVLGIIGYYADEVAPEIYHRLASYGFYGRPALLS